MIHVYEDGEKPDLPDASGTNQLAYLRLKPVIDAKYPKDWYVGIDAGEVVADAASFESLQTKLLESGHDSPDVLVVQSGEDTEFLWIL